MKDSTPFFKSLEKLNFLLSNKGLISEEEQEMKEDIEDLKISSFGIQQTINNNKPYNDKYDYALRVMSDLNSNIVDIESDLMNIRKLIDTIIKRY